MRVYLALVGQHAFFAGEGAGRERGRGGEGGVSWLVSELLVPHHLFQNGIR